jgi:hypothetical protein
MKFSGNQSKDADMELFSIPLIKKDETTDWHESTHIMDFDSTGYQYEPKQINVATGMEKTLYECQ